MRLVASSNPDAVARDQALRTALALLLRWVRARAIVLTNVCF